MQIYYYRVFRKECRVFPQLIFDFSNMLLTSIRWCPTQLPILRRAMVYPHAAAQPSGQPAKPPPTPLPPPPSGEVIGWDIFYRLPHPNATPRVKQS